MHSSTKTKQQKRKTSKTITKLTLTKNDEK
jgi:hypothetical protein